MKTIHAVLVLMMLAVPLGAAPRDEPITPIQPAVITNAMVVELGKQLYFDPRLSKSGFISCNSCHNLSMGGTDNLPTSIGHGWQRGPINAPTVLNSSLSVAQFWDGRARTLQEQAGGPIANPGEMAFTHELAVEVIGSIPQYVSEFETAFGEPAVTIDRLTRAIAAFEETLVTPNSRFDQWLMGNNTALTAKEYTGYQVFKSSGCTSCHNGPAAGGTAFRKMGVVRPYRTTNAVEGRASVTKLDADRFTFKVPSIRNVALTYPYFHDGAAATLRQAVEIMGEVQLGRTFTTEENEQIVAFLNTLTGDQPRLELPILPPSSDSTPRPQPFEVKPRTD